MGYFDKLEDDSLAVRKLAGIVMQLCGSKATIKQIWPLKEDIPDQVASWAETPKEMIEKILSVHGIKLKK